MASFPKCVSYRLPMRIGAALALSLAVPAFGQDSPPAGSSAQQAATADNAGSKESAERKAAGPELIVVTGGSVRERANAQETEDLSLPELPTAPDGSAAGK